MSGGVEFAAWRRVRRHAVPRPVIERATERRLAGDWLGACAAANVQAGFTLDDVAARHGAETAERMAGDLRHFAPDLLRWHLPRTGCGRTTFEVDLAVRLFGHGDVSLYALTPPLVTGPQRLRLVLDAGDREVRDWTQAPYLFDARRSDDLLGACGGTERAPFFRADGTPLTGADLPASAPDPGDRAALAEWTTLLQERGDLEEAFAAAGLDLDLTEPENWPAWLGSPRSQAGGSPLFLPALPGLVRGLSPGPDGTRTARIERGWSSHMIMTAPADGERVRVSLFHGWNDAPGTALDPRACRPLPDLELLRAGAITPEELHPLVRSALFPERAPAAGPVGPPDPELPKPVRVRCRGEWHEVRSRGGVLDVPHTDEERRREEALRAFGGAVSGCFAVRGVWRTGEGRLQRGLRDQRRELFLRVQHGDTDGVLRLLDAGVDPFVRDARRRTLMHCLHTMDHTVMLPRLLKEGLGLEDLDHHGRTPLHVAVGDDGSADLIRALADAGARTDVVDDNDMGVQELIEWRERTDLEWLVD